MTMALAGGYRAAVYCRLSKDDDLQGESASIANQRDMMEKQHNRGQEGAGLACVKLEANPGEEYMFRERALGSGAITADMFY